MICKGRYETLICPRSTRIEIVRASYGLYTNRGGDYNKIVRLCNIDTDRRSRTLGDRVANCEAPTGLQVVQQSCDGQQQCTLYAHDTVFVDHCGKNVYSILDVTYKCAANNNGESRAYFPSRFFKHIIH